MTTSVKLDSSYDLKKIYIKKNEKLMKTKSNSTTSKFDEFTMQEKTNRKMQYVIEVGIDLQHDASLHNNQYCRIGCVLLQV